ncbi:hypothetical protein [Collinsella intestinalis]|uniref:hypothetical protein n=1 Tax=Collinsella intestinalis TaxID=147207 RepID=UPI0025A3985D|nr:hypothetical protein [Collinsella intestinalis]MDM8162431.1 hypothetical protein [Collinsella intestinalis]
MSDETREPQTFEDLWLMRETSKAWFDGALRYEDVRKGADPEVGAVDSMSWRVVPASDRVLVCRDTHVICEVRGSRSFSCRVEGETVAEYRSMDDFRASEWWGLTMEKFAGGDADASWLRSFELDGEDVCAEPTWIGYGPSVSVSMKVGRQYRDWLGNTRQDKSHDTLSIRVERMSGELWLRCGEHEVEGTVEEIEEAMMLIDRLKSLGVEVGDETITVPLRKGDDGR